MGIEVPAFYLLQGNGTVPVQLPGHWLLVVSLGLVVLFLAAIGYYIGGAFTSLKHRKEQDVDKQKMFDIEQALKGFWENERQKFAEINEELSQKIEFLEKEVDKYRKKAAGVGLMGLSLGGKSKQAEMLMQLMLENETLEEKLFEQNLKVKEERDEHLAKELRNITHKRILLSEILKDQGIQDRIREVLGDSSKIKGLKLPSGAEFNPKAIAAGLEEEEDNEEEGEEEEDESS